MMRYGDMKLFRNPWFWCTLVGLIVLSLIWSAYRFNWSGTGFHGKTVWDWLSLLIVPLVLASVALLFNHANTRTERQITQQRYEQDKEIALDKQQEDILQSYLNRMSELLLEKGLGISPVDAQVRNVARTRTISILIQLDVRRIGYVFAFLREAGLIDLSSPVIDLKDADLSKVNWIGANLSGANLSGANFWGANLSETNLSKGNFSKAEFNAAFLIGANLKEADFTGAQLNIADFTGARADPDAAKIFRADPEIFRADLSGAIFTEAQLMGAHLSGANLSGANFSKAYLSGADLSGADLSGADLSGTNIIGANLIGANLIGANLSAAWLKEAKIDKSKLTPEQIAQARWD